MAKVRKMIYVIRLCYACGSDKTYVRKNGYLKWYPNPPIGWLCSKCYTKYIAMSKWRPKYNLRLLKFKDKKVLAERPVRIGVCNWCRAVVPFDCKRTNIHHEVYDDSDVLKHSIEVCASCHGVETRRKKST